MTKFLVSVDVRDVRRNDVIEWCIFYQKSLLPCEDREEKQKAFGRWVVYHADDLPSLV